MKSKHKMFAKQLSSLCKIFSNETRVLIIWSLYGEEKTVGAIAEELDTSIQNTSQHLRLMVDKGLLTCRRDGRNIYYKLSNMRQPINWQLLLDHQRFNQNP